MIIFLASIFEKYNFMFFSALMKKCNKNFFSQKKSAAIPLPKPLGISNEEKNDHQA
jgi:hypothetical protein